METAEDRLQPLTRSGMMLAGFALLLLAWPIGFGAMVIAGGGHGSPFDSNWIEAAFGVTMLAIPVLMIIIGIACLAATTRGRMRVAGMLALLIPVDLAAAVVTMQLAMRPDSVVAYPVQPTPDLSRPAAAVGGGPTIVSIACSAAGDECVTTTTEHGPTGEKTTRKVEKVAPRGEQ